MANDRNMLLGLLQIIDANGGAIESRIVLQKQAYLLAYSGYPQVSPSSFSYHHYGPFSRELSDFLQFATSSGLLLEHSSPGMNDGVKYSYEITDRGRQFLEEAGKLGGRFLDQVGTFKHHNWRTLELAATVLFLQSREKVDRGSALGLALELKPDTKNRKEDAEKLLASVA